MKILHPASILTMKVSIAPSQHQTIVWQLPGTHDNKYSSWMVMKSTIQTLGVILFGLVPNPEEYDLSLHAMLFEPSFFASLCQLYGDFYDARFAWVGMVQPSMNFPRINSCKSGHMRQRSLTQPLSYKKFFDFTTAHRRETKTWKKLRRQKIIFSFIKI